MTPAGELRALGELYGLPVAVLADLANRHGDALERYAEWVLERDTFSLVTLGRPADLVPLADALAQPRFARAVAAWPGVVAGIKLDATGRRGSTLYVRTVCPWAQGLAWLEAEMGPVARTVPAARTLYGLGFQGELVKTYALSPGGFVSWRLRPGEVAPSLEHKDYRADVAWDDIAWPDTRWCAVGELGRRLGFTTANHLARHASTGELKVYVERRGGIPTDRSLA